MVNTKTVRDYRPEFGAISTLLIGIAFDDAASTKSRARAIAALEVLGYGGAALEARDELGRDAPATQDDVLDAQFDVLVDQAARLTAVEESVAELEDKIVQLGVEFRCRRIVIVDEQDRERVELGTVPDGPAWLIVRHHEIEGACVTLIAGQDCELDGGPVASVQVSNATTTESLDAFADE